MKTSSEIPDPIFELLSTVGPLESVSNKGFHCELRAVTNAGQTIVGFIVSTSTYETDGILDTPTGPEDKRHMFYVSLSEAFDSFKERSTQNA